MAPNKSSKKGGGKKGGGESKTGAAVRALDDDEEDKIQVTSLSLPSVFMCSQEEHDKATFDDDGDDFLSSRSLFIFVIVCAR